MKEFTLDGFVTHLGILPLEVEHASHHALEKSGEIVKTEAQHVIGTYDYGWVPLAKSTLENKAADTPLLETGEMRDSIEFTVGHLDVEIGSNSDKAVWQELGTVKIPPRSFLVGALQHKKDDVLDVIGRAVTKALAGDVVVKEHLI